MNGIIEVTVRSVQPYMNISAIRTGTVRSASSDVATKAGYAYHSAELSSINKEG
jgi:hypothetical protein